MIKLYRNLPLVSVLLQTITFTSDFLHGTCTLSAASSAKLVLLNCPLPRVLLDLHVLEATYTQLPSRLSWGGGRGRGISLVEEPTQNLKCFLNTLPDNLEFTYTPTTFLSGPASAAPVVSCSQVSSPSSCLIELQQVCDGLILILLVPIDSVSAPSTSLIALVRLTQYLTIIWFPLISCGISLQYISSSVFHSAPSFAKSDLPISGWISLLIIETMSELFSFSAPNWIVLRAIKSFIRLNTLPAIRFNFIRVLSLQVMASFLNRKRK